MKVTIFPKKRDFLFSLSFFLFFSLIIQLNAESSKEDCPLDKPIYKSSTDTCVMEYCTKAQYDNEECKVANSVIEKQWINEFLYETEASLPIYSSIGGNDQGDVFFESSSGLPFSQKKLFTLKSDGREYIDGIKRNIINLGNDKFSNFGTGAVVTINGHKCYMKLAANESLEMYDFDDKKYTFANLKEKFGYDVISEKNSLIRTNVDNTFIYAYITTDNYLIMQKFKVVSNDAKDCIQMIKTLKEDVKSLPNNIRSCMITTKQYIECIDLLENQMYTVRIYDSNLNYMNQLELEKNNAPLEKAKYSYHETVLLKGEISIFVYYVDVTENDAKPILVLKELSIKNNKATLSNVKPKLIRDTLYIKMAYKFSDTENSLAIFNEYYFGVTSLTIGENQHLIVALLNIFNDDKTIDTHYFDIPLNQLYDINYKSGLRAFGYKNAYGVQMNYVHNNIPSSGFIVFGYANTTDPEPVNRLFDKYDSYTLKIKDFYKGIENNLFCYVFVNIEVTEIPSSYYFSVKTSSGSTVYKGTKLSLNDVIIIKKVSGRTPPVGRYVLGLTPYLNEADYKGFTDCAVGSDMFGQQVDTSWLPDEYYGRTIEFKFTVGVDCYENCLTCDEKGVDANDQKCKTCKSGYYFVENTNNCFGEIPEGYYFDESKKVYMECYETCKFCNGKKNGIYHNCKICKNGLFLSKNTNCLNCKSLNKYINYEQTDCIDAIPEGYYVNDTEYNTIDKCYKNCLTCSESSLDDKNMKCIKCKNGYYILEGTNNCINEVNEGEYIDNDDNTIKKCNEACKRCSNKEILNEKGEVTNCDSCNNDKGYYLIEGTNICTNKKEDNEYYDDDCKCYKKCYKDCLTCSEKEIDKYNMNCLSCDISKGYIYFSNTKNCLNCKSLNKYVNYAQNDCIDEIPDGYYVNDTEKNTIDKCHPNCLTCKSSSIDDESMQCLSCDKSKGYYFISGTNNCEKNPYPNHYLDTDETFKPCYNLCLTCSTGPVANEKSIVTNMNCDSCDELKGLYLLKGTKNCEKNEDIYTDVCPEEKPILKDNKCIMEHCSKEQFDNKECIVSNPIIKTQWIDEFPYVYEIDKPIYSTLGQMSNDDIVFESNMGNPLTDRKIYTLNDKSRGFFEGKPEKIIDLKSDLFSTNGNGVLFKINGKKNYMRLSNYETLELYDLDDNKSTFARLDDKLEYKVESIKNSLLKLKEENTFIYAYITTGNRLIMSKFKITSNDINEGFQLIKTSLENFTTISKNSRRCLITENEYIECLDVTEDQVYVIRIYNKDLEFLKQYDLEKNNAPKERAYYTYHECIWLKEEVGIFIYYTDISDKNAKPFVTIKKLQKKNNDEIELINVSKFYDKEMLYNTLPYIVSDSENSLAKINDYYFALATITSYENSHLLIAILNIYNEDDSIVVNYFDVPMKDLYDIKYYANLQAFGYKNMYGVQFDHKKGNEYRSGFIIFGFGNSTDLNMVDNLFEKNDKYIITPGKNIKMQNNVFCYRLLNVILTDIPDALTSHIIITRNNQAKTKLRKGDILSLNEEIIITYQGDKKDIPKGNYILSFTPYYTEADYDDYYGCSFDEENLGQIVPKLWRPDEYYGRTFNFEFTVGKCYENCMTCSAIGYDADNQLCDTCAENFYFLEGTKNCYDTPPEGYYLDEEEEEKIYKKCYETCKICDKKGIKTEHNCIVCKEGYLLYKNTNCLNCKSLNKYVNYAQNDCIDEIPDGYYVNDTEKNTIDKCYEKCLKCKKKGNQYNMECTACKNEEGYYFISGTKNCEKMPIPGYYIDKEDNQIKKCDIACATCSYRPIKNEDDEITNCDTCNKDLGFYFREGTTICTNKTKEGEYYDEDCKCYKKCHKNCKTCSGEAIDEYHMNCLSCNTNKGYEFFEKTSNCLNCKSINKYVNNEETECIDEIPDGYYINDTDKNTLTECHKNCLKCEKLGTDENQYCTTCMPPLYLKNGNCVKTYNCPYKFFYQAKIDKFADSSQKICLDKDEICPCALPFYLTTTNECVQSCPLDLIFYQGCKISNIPYGLYNIISLVKVYFMQGLLNSISKTFTLSDIYYFYNIFVKISVKQLLTVKVNSLRNLQKFDDFSSINFQSLSSDNFIKINATNDFEGGEVDLGECENKLRKYYDINDDIPLILIKLYFKNNDSKKNHIQYEIFNPYNRSEKLDLSICEEQQMKVKVTNPMEITPGLSKISNIIDTSSDGLFSETNNNGFYKDICTIFTSEEGAYVLPQDRYLDYNYEQQYCDEGCSINKINFTAGTVECLCKPDNGFDSINITNIENIIKEEAVKTIEKEIIGLEDNINDNNKYKNQKYSLTNIKAMKCIKRMFSNELSKNYISIIFSILFLTYIIAFIYFIIRNRLFMDCGEEKTNNINNNNIKEKGVSNPPKVTVDPKNIKSSNEYVNQKPNKKNINKENINQDIDFREFNKIKKDNNSNSNDKRSFIEMFISSLRKRLPILSFFNKSEYFLELKILLLVISLINYFAVNTFFFSEKNIHQIYLDKDVYNFSYQFKFIISSLFISFIFFSIQKYFYNIKNNKCSLQYIILFLVSTAIFLFYWLYVGAITSVYINIKKHLILNIIIGYAFGILFDSLLSFISVCLRRYSLKGKGNETIYKISQKINLI